MTPRHTPAGTPPELALTPVRPSRSFDQVIRQLRELIRSGHLRVGDRLPSERSLAEQFNVSRNMVREALRMLEVTGLIELRPGRYGGAFVSSGRADIVSASLSDMMRLEAFSLADLTEARLWLSTAIVRAATERATEEQLRQLEGNVSAAAARAQQVDWPGVAKLNMAFHDLLVETTGNPVLVMIHASVMGVIREISGALGPIRSDVTIRHRQRIVQHLRQRDADAAAAEMARNLRSVHEYWLNRIGDRDIRAVIRPTTHQL